MFTYDLELEAVALRVLVSIVSEPDCPSHSPKCCRSSLFIFFKKRETTRIYRLHSLPPSVLSPASSTTLPTATFSAVCVGQITTWNVHCSDLLHNLDRRVPATMPIEERKSLELFYFRLDLISISAIITSSSILWCSKQQWVAGLPENACGMVACTAVVAVLAFMNGVSDPVADANSAKAIAAFEAAAAALQTSDGADSKDAKEESEAEEGHAAAAATAAAAAAAAAEDLPGVEPFNSGFFIIKLVFMVQFFFLFGHMMYVAPPEYTATTKVVWLTYLPGFIVYGTEKHCPAGI